MSHSPNLKVFIFTLPPSISGQSKWSRGEDPNKDIDEDAYIKNLEMFNNKIRQIANEIDNVEVVDLFNYFNETRNGMHVYANDAIHPNAVGMKKIADYFLDTLYKTFIEE